VIAVDLPPVPAHHIDPVTQREVADDPTALAASIATLTALLGTDPADELAVRARLGVELRPAGRLDEALAVLTVAVELARADPRRLHHARIRLAHVHQWRGDFGAADALFAELLAAAPAHGALTEAFTWQHAGRNAYDQGRYAEAGELFAAALAIRERVGAPVDQVESSRAALAAARREESR
jgi:tetratricopeptide (TPR) repeat protein